MLDALLITSYRVGLDIIEMLLENYEGRRSFKKYASFLVQISHFDTDMVSRFSYAEIAIAAILVTSAHVGDFSAENLIPAFLRSDRAEQAAIMLRQVAARRGLTLASVAKPVAASPSPANVDSAAVTPAWA
jgi:hypothetical protein